MKVGDLVKVITNDMSLIIKNPGPKDNKFFNQIGTIIKVHKNDGTIFNPVDWYGVLFPAGYYDVCSYAIKVINEGR